MRGEAAPCPVYAPSVGKVVPDGGRVFFLRRRWWKRGNPFRHFALRNATSPEGGGLGKEGRSRPHRLLARRSLPLSCKLSALAKASPFRERWHGEAVTERVLCLSAVGKDSLARFPLKTVQKNAPVCYTSLCASGFCAAAQFCGGEKPPKTTLCWFLDGVQGLRRVGTAGCPMGRSGRRSFSGENDCSTWNIETFPGRGRNRAWQRSLRSQTKRAV